MSERQESGRTSRSIDSEEEFRRKDREYFDLIGRTVMHGDQALPIIAFQWLRFGAGHLFTLQLPDGREMGAQRHEFYVPPSREQLVKVMDDHRIEAFNGSQAVCECNLTWVTNAEYREHLAEAVLTLFDSTTSTEGETQS